MMPPRDPMQVCHEHRTDVLTTGWTWVDYAGCLVGAVVLVAVVVAGAAMASMGGPLR